MFHQMQGSFRSTFGLISSIFYVFATQQRFLSSVQLLVNNELFHQSSFYWKNVVLLFQLLLQQRYLHFSPGWKSPGGNVLDPLYDAVTHARATQYSHLIVYFQLRDLNERNLYCMVV